MGGGKAPQQQTLRKRRSQPECERKPSVCQLREPAGVDDDIRRLENQVNQLKTECKILQRARDESVVVASQMIKEIERLEDLLKSQRKAKEQGSKTTSP
ncbi:hypothetical protein G647_07753 [Cladophialophora carrionii CBS 160.54]|uniref:Uncharacterized protein n=1 Tax=Cladophialophora carrionii CBS 160.54 TaxID=1279043 RepID=V9D440_9EURO|nr:uncharacterized protein G647_07753 [Cladophialophora carrionii CBS 160.54]ETI21406.1 hypothetical protein G647_07753 [Cladophialophora carrionii CBS 160.54]